MSTLRRLLRLTVAQRSLLAGTLVAQLGYIAFNLLLPTLTKNAIDRGIVGADLTFLMIVAGIIVLSTALRGVLWQHVINGYQKIGFGTSRFLRDQIYEKVQRSALVFHTGARSGDLFSNATIDVGAIEEFLNMGIRELVNLTVMSVLTILMLLQIDARLTLVALPTFLAVAALAVFYGPRARERYRRIQMEYGRTTSTLQENLNGIRVVKAFAREPGEIARFRTQVDTLYAANMRAMTLNSIVFPTMTLATSVGIAAIIYFGGQDVIRGTITLGGLVAFISYLTMLVMPVRGLGIQINLLTTAMAGGERIFTLLGHRHVIEEVEQAGRKPAMPPIRGEIAFDGVTFGYKASDPVLQDVSFVAAPGQTIGIVGLTGSGKSTLTMLLARFADPLRGAIRVDGRDIREVALATYRRQVGMVFQEAFLFSSSIADNIRFGRPEATQEEVEAAARTACLHDFVVGLPEGYATMLGERGITLSGGQRQRLALARALLVDPRILVLDDTTSAVDPVTEREIWSRVRARRRGETTIIIAQRVASVRDADQILVLERGTVVERGTHAELLGRDGLYARLQRQQASQAENVIDDDQLLEVSAEPNGKSNGAPMASEDAAMLSAVVPATRPPSAAPDAKAEKPAKRDVLSLNPEDDMILGKAYDHSLMIRLLEFVRPFTRRMIITIACMMFMSIAGLASPYVQKLAIDGPITQGDPMGLQTIALAFAGIGVVQWVFQVSYNYLLNTVAQGVLRSLRASFFGHLQSLSLNFFDRYKVGRLMSVMTGDIQAISNLLGNGIVQAISDVFILIGVIIALLSVDPRLSLYTFSVLPAIAIATVVLRHFARENFRNVRRSNSILNGALAEGIAGVRVTQAYGREEVNRANFSRLNDQLWKHALRAGFVMSVFSPTLDLIGSFATALILGYGGYLVVTGNVSIGVLVAFIGYSTRFFEPIRDLTMRYNALQAAMAASERIFALLDTQPDIVDAPSAETLGRIRGDLAFDHVTFGYNPERTVLHDVNLGIRPGEQVAIVGPTGAGKTSIISLACRFYDVKEGAIRVDGADVRSVTVSSLRQQIGVVLQDPFLFTGTIAENLAFGKPEATHEDMVRVCQAVGIHEFIEKQPFGYNTEVSERGANFSAGQRQLISFARALLADPRILILDEATSSVDTVTEAQLQDALKLLVSNRTAIIIAHRLSTVRSADRIVVLEAGRIVEVGNHEELMRQNGHYARLNRALAYRPEAQVAG